MADPAHILLWSDPAHAGLLEGIARHPGLSIAAVGAPDAAQGTRLAATLKVTHAPDLRAALDQGRDLDLVLITTLSVLNREERSALARFSGPVVSVEPRPIRFADLRDAPEDAALCAPAPRWTSVLESPALTETMRQFGPVHAAHVLREAPAHAGSLRSLFVDGLDLLTQLLGEPDCVDAAQPGPPASTDTLTLPAGSLTAHLRFAGGGAATMMCRAGAARERCDACLHGSTGTLTLTREQWTWSAPDGAIFDEGVFPDARVLAPDRIALELVSLLENAPRREVPVAERIMLLAAAEAARISIMTRSSEGITPLIELAGRAAEG